MSMDRLPLELLELLLLRTFVKLFTDHYKSQFNVRRVSVQRSYTALAAVCYNWWQTMNGWPQSPTGHWFRHQLRNHVKNECRTIHTALRSARFIPMRSTVWGVTCCDDKLFVVCDQLNEILVFGPNNKQMPSIRIKDKIKQPNDIVACTETGHLYVVDLSEGSSVWRVSLKGRNMSKWLPNSTSARNHCRQYWSLSVKSMRLLVTTKCRDGLLLYGPDGVELAQVFLPFQLQHAVETPRGTFLAIDRGSSSRICEVSTAGCVLRSYGDQHLLGRPCYLALDSSGRVFIADGAKQHVVLLDDRLELERVLEAANLTDISCICYVERAGRLVIPGRQEFTPSIGLFHVHDRRPTMLPSLSSDSLCMNSKVQCSTM